MSSIFISHSNQDHAIAAEIAIWLKQQGYTSIFLDFDPADGIPAGRNWAQELYKELKACRAMLVLCSEPSQSSEWCFAEFIHAKALGKAILPIKIAPCTLRPLISEIEVIDLTSNQEEGYQRLRRALSIAGMDPGQDYIPGIRPPYPGLAVFQEEDAPIFFGRDEEIQECIDHLRKLHEFGGVRLLLVLGASGSGKSSLVRAGVIPRLKRARPSWRVIGPVRPSLLSAGVGPSGIMSQFLSACGQKLHTKGMIGELIELNLVTPGESTCNGAPGADATILVFIDQFEEFLDSNLDKRAASFLNQFTSLLRSTESKILAVATLRSDFFEEFQKHPAFRDIPFEQLSIGPLSKGDFAEVIEEPARLEEIELESGLVHAIINDTQTGDALPLLSFTLRELWEHHGKDRKLTIAEYKELGRLEGSVALAADAVLSAETSSEQHKEELLDAFLPLVHIDEQKRYVKRIAYWSSIEQRHHGLLERFVAKRLLVSKSEKDDRDQKGDRVIEVAHEALFTTWCRLVKRLEKEKDNLILWERLRRAAKEWEEKGRSHDLLNHRGEELEKVEKLIAKPRFIIDSVEQAYLAACINLRDAARKSELAKRRRRYYLIAALFIVLLIISVSGLYALQQRKTAHDHLTRLHWANGIFARDNDKSRDIIKASHHFMKAAELADNLQSRNNAYLAGALLTRDLQLRLILEHDKEKKLISAVFNRDHQQILTWDETGTGISWDMRNGEKSQIFEPEENQQLTWSSPGGNWIMRQDSAMNIRVLNAHSGQTILTAAQQKKGWPKFNEDESKLVSWSEDGYVSIFDMIKISEVAKLQAPDEINKVIPSSSGKRVLLVGKNSNITLWRSDNSVKSCKYPGNSLIEGEGALFSPDDNRMFLWTKDGVALLWDTRNGCKHIATLPGYAKNPGIIGALFSSDKRSLIAWNYEEEGALSRWDIDKKSKPIPFLYAHSHRGGIPAPSAIEKGVLSKDESLFLTYADDGKARIWEVESGKELQTINHEGRLRGAVFNESANLVLTWSDNNHSAMLWNTQTGELVGFPLLHNGPVCLARFSEDNKHIVTCGEDGTARLWTIEDQPVNIDFQLQDAPQVIFWKESERKIIALTHAGNLEVWNERGERIEFRHLADTIEGGQFNKDGKQILTRSKDHTIRLWNTESGQPLTPQLRHDESLFGVRGVAYSPDEKWLLSWGDDHTARIWDKESGKLLLKLDHGLAVRGAIANPDRSRVLSWSDERLVRLWETQKGTTLQTLEHTSEILSARFLTNSSQILTWSTDGLIRVWDVQSGSKPKVFHHGEKLGGVVPNAAGNLLLSWTDDGTIRLWDITRSGDDIPPPALHESGFSEVAGSIFYANNNLILIWGIEEDSEGVVKNGGVRIWDNHMEQPLTRILQDDKPIANALLSHDASRIFAWSEDGSVKFWHLNIPSQQEQLVAHQEKWTGTRLNNQWGIDALDSKTWKKLTE